MTQRYPREKTKGIIRKRSHPLGAVVGDHALITPDLDGDVPPAQHPSLTCRRHAARARAERHLRHHQEELRQLGHRYLGWLVCSIAYYVLNLVVDPDCIAIAGFFILNVLRT